MATISPPLAEPKGPRDRGRRLPLRGPAGDPTPSSRGPAIDRHSLRRRLITTGLLAVCVATLVLAVPDLRPAIGDIENMDPALVVAAIILEFASCLCFVIIFRLFFSPVPKRAARDLAWSQMGSGALLPGGGVGSLAIGGWLLHLAGMPTRQIVQRSSGLFFLTSAINVLTLGVAGLLLLLGISEGPHDLLRAGLPVVAAIGAIALALALPALARRVWSHRPRASWLDDVGVGIPVAADAIIRPHWRLAGAVGYLLFDIAVLWLTFAAVGPPPPAIPLIVAYLAGYLANVLPIPGGIGALDAGLVGALTLYGLPLAHAAAAVLVYHAIAFWIPALGGMVGYTRLRPRLVSGAGELGAARTTA